MATIPASTLLRGMWYALGQSGYLLQDAMTLYTAGAYSSAVAMAMFGREELGKYRILIELWREAEKGDLPDADVVRDACGDHIKKQRKAVLSISFMGEPGSQLDKLLRQRMKYQPQDQEFKEADKAFQTLFESMAKRAPDDRHDARMAALYVDLTESGEWSRPRAIRLDDARKLVTDAINDYLVQANNLQTRTIDPKLGAALDQWPDRPELPRPVHPSQFGEKAASS